MKNAIARIMLMLVLALAVVFVSACGNTPDGTPGDGTQGGGLDGSDGTNENLTDWSVEAVYARAVTYGYEGSLEEFVELVSGKDGKDGKDGVGIQSLSIVNGSLAVVLTDGKVIDAGPVSGPAGVGIEKTEINENDELIVYYTDGTSDNLGKIVGEKGNVGEAGKDGEKGKDGVGIEKIEMNEKNELIIYLTDGTSKNYGPVCTHKGTDSEVYTVAFDSNGGSAVENQYVTRGDKVKIPAEPTKEGAYFDGWWVGEERWSFIGYPVTEDITLTAKWATNAEVKVYAVFNDYSDPETAMEEGVLYSTTPWVLDSNIGLTAPKAWEDGTFIKSISVCGLKGGIILGSEAFDYDESDPETLKFKAKVSAAETVVIVRYAKDYSYNGWETTGLLIEYSENTINNELSSGTRRYYAGADTTANDSIDVMVRERNADAEEAANVTLKYSWLDDIGEYSWGSNVGRIVTQTAVTIATAPDIYVNFVYDMTNAQLRGCFANLLSQDPGVYEYGNYFRFTAEDYDPITDNYFDAKAGEGYLYEYMRSLSLTPDTKMYCLASDFTLDAHRAFLVMPVNVYMMNGIKAESAPAGDRVGNGDGHNIADFYDLVWNNEWDYDVLAGYSNAVFKGNLDGSAKADIYDTLGLCLGTLTGYGSIGMLYSADISIIEYNEQTGKYYYPETAPELTEFVNSLRTLMKNNESNGIATINSTEVNGVSYGTDLKAIRARFAENNILFGGITTVGALEDDVYQGMKENGGFGVVPVPLYKYYVEGQNEYKTVIHNIGRIAAIASNSMKKSQCSKYLDYQSTHSSEIAEEYYEYKLNADVEAAADNVKMMTYIRNHARNCFDMTFEDAISFNNRLTDLNADATRWHYMIQKENFQLSNISTRYEEHYEDKQADLDAIYALWTTLK